MSMLRLLNIYAKLYKLVYVYGEEKSLEYELVSWRTVT